MEAIVENRHLTEPILKHFEVDASHCDLLIGDRVTPETVVGRDYKTDEMIQAGVYGQVAVISFNSTHHSLSITIATGED
jgi:hypothetical protein